MHITLQNEDIVFCISGIDICKKSSLIKTDLFYIGANVLPRESLFKCRCLIINTNTSDVEMQIVFETKQISSECNFEINSKCVEAPMQITMARASSVTYRSTSRNASNITLCISGISKRKNMLYYC